LPTVHCAPCGGANVRGQGKVALVLNKEPRREDVWGSGGTALNLSTRMEVVNSQLHAAAVLPSRKKLQIPIEQEAV